MKKFRISNIFLIVIIFLISSSLINELFLGFWDKVFLCAFSLILLIVLKFVQYKFNFFLSNTLELLICCFIFLTSILGEVYNFYTLISWWDILVHFFSGVLGVAVCFAFLRLVFKNCSKGVSYILLIVSICFSITIGVMWEFGEYYTDKYLNWDGQKDTILTKISSIKLDASKNSKPVVIKDISKTTLYNKEEQELAIIKGGYLDIGLNDTMLDLMIAFLGSSMYVAFIIMFLKFSNIDSYQKRFGIVKLNR